MPVLGMGGLFFRSADPDALALWYRTHLGVGAGCVADPFARVDLTPGLQPDLAGGGEVSGEGRGKERTPPPRSRHSPKSKSKSKVMRIFRPNPLVTTELLPGARPATNPQASAASFPAWSFNLGHELPA